MREAEEFAEREIDGWEGLAFPEHADPHASKRDRIRRQRRPDVSNRSGPCDLSQDNRVPRRNQPRRISLAADAERARRLTALARFSGGVLKGNRPGDNARVRSEEIIKTWRHGIQVRSAIVTRQPGSIQHSRSESSDLLFLEPRIRPGDSA